VKRACIEIGIFVGVVLAAWGIIAIPWFTPEGEDFRFVKALIVFPIAIAVWLRIADLDSLPRGTPYLDRVCGMCHREMRADGESWVCPECGRLKPRPRPRRAS
jgi:hypothetical protein